QTARPKETPAGNGIYIKMIETGIQTEEVEEPGITAGIHIKVIEVKFITKELKLYQVEESGLKQTAMTGETRQLEKPKYPVPLRSLTVNVSKLLCFRVLSLG
ncbi:unnamed protein product, partial [Porites lobata]